LASLLFKNIPSLEEESVCNIGCLIRKKKLPIAQINSTTILEKLFLLCIFIINDNTTLTGKKKVLSKVIVQVSKQYFTK